MLKYVWQKNTIPLILFYIVILKIIFKNICKIHSYLINTNSEYGLPYLAVCLVTFTLFNVHLMYTFWTFNGNILNVFEKYRYYNNI